MTDINQTHWSASRWAEAIDAHLAANGPQAPFVNIDNADSREFDAIFLGGAAGRFGAAYLRAMGGWPLIVDRWPFLGGSCPHHACVPHHVFADVAAQLLLERTFSGKLWFQNMDGKTVSMLEIVDMFCRGRTGPHAFMNYQSKEQLDLEFVLGAPATVVDAQRISVACQIYTAKNLVLATGSRQSLTDRRIGFARRVQLRNPDRQPGLRTRRNCRSDRQRQNCGRIWLFFQRHRPAHADGVARPATADDSG